MGKVYLKVDGKLVSYEHMIVTYDAGYVPPVVLGYPMYLYNSAAFLLTVGGSGNYQLDNDGASPIDQSFPTTTYNFLTPSNPVTVTSTNINSLDLLNQNTITDLILSANTHLTTLNIEGDTMLGVPSSLPDIDLNQNTNLSTLTIGLNTFTNLILSGCTSLATFNVNSMTTINGILDLSNTLVTSFNAGNIQ